MKMNWSIQIIGQIRNDFDSNWISQKNVMKWVEWISRFQRSKSMLFFLFFFFKLYRIRLTKMCVHHIALLFLSFLVFSFRQMEIDSPPNYEYTHFFDIWLKKKTKKSKTKTKTEHYENICLREKRKTKDELEKNYANVINFNIECDVKWIDSN